jgi:exodeoxyribonuclease V alpha subunit
VTYHNEENGFCVLRVKARGQRDLITIVDHGRRLSDSLGVTAIRWIHKT